MNNSGTMAVRLSADWMVKADDRILEFVEAEGARPPKLIAEDGRVRFSRQHISNRCRALAEAGLLQNIGNGIYRLTNSGSDYLAGELDAAELPDPTE